MDERETTCITYYNYAKEKIGGLRNGFDKQFFAKGLRDVWTSFDAFLGLKFPDKNNTEMRRKFSAHYQSLFENWSMPDMFKESLKKLCELAPVRDTSPIDPRPDIPLNNLDNLFEILQLCYRVRSNLDHGGKDLENEGELGKRNRALVEHSFKVTFIILEKTLLNEGIIRG